MNTDQGENFFNPEEDIKQIKRWAAHKDLINCVTFVPELDLVATCSFDCNVYMWDKEDCSRKGSLVLGTGTSINSQQTGGEKTKLGKIWDIKVDKKPRHLQDRLEAQQLIEECERIDYQAMFNKGKALDPRE